MSDLQDHLLALDQEVLVERDNLEDGPNVDAIKAALSTVHRGIDHLRNAQEQVEGLDRG